MRNDCKLRNFTSFIFSIGVKIHICNVKNLRQEHNLPTSVNGRVMLLFCEGFIFAKIKPSHNYQNLPYFVTEIM